MAPSTLDGLSALVRLTNRAATPDRSAALKTAKDRFEQAQKAYRSAKSPDRANEAISDRQESLTGAQEKLAKAIAAHDLALAKLKDARSAQLSPTELQALADAVTTATDREVRATRKVDRLREEVKLAGQAIARAKTDADIQSAEVALQSEQEKLSRATIQLRLRRTELKQADDALTTAQRSAKSPEAIKLLEERANELQGHRQRAADKVADCTVKLQQARDEAQTIAADYITAELDWQDAEADLADATQATAAERRFERIETALDRVDGIRNQTSDVKAAIALLPEAEIWWNGLCLAWVSLVAVVYFTPLAGVLQGATKTIKWAEEKGEVVGNSIDSFWAPDLQGTPKKGETIAGWQVTSPYGKRSAPCKGCSDQHGGVDVADPAGGNASMGRILYAVGQAGTKVEVTCWQDKNGGGTVATLQPASMPGRKIEYLHLSNCQSGTVEAGAIVARVGNSGSGTAPHLHVQEKAGDKLIPPRRGIVWWALTGEEPQPVVTQRNTQ